MQYAEIPGNSRREFDDGKFPGIPEREFPVALLLMAQPLKHPQSESAILLRYIDIIPMQNLVTW